MFAVTEAEATAIRDAFHQHGEFAAAVELRRLFPGITDNRLARQCVRTIAGWPLRPARPPAQAAGSRTLVPFPAQSGQCDVASASATSTAKK